MGRVSFTTRRVRRFSDNQTFTIVTLARETQKDLFEVNIYPDGTRTFTHQSRPVESLPVLPSTKQLLAAADRVAGDAVELLQQPEGSAAKNAAWWAIKQKIDAL